MNTSVLIAVYNDFLPLYVTEQYLPLYLVQVKDRMQGKRESPVIEEEVSF